MNADSGHPQVTRAHALLGAALGAFIWLLLGAFGAGGSAAASEERSPGFLVDTVSGATTELPSLPDLTAPAVATSADAVLEQVIEPVAAELVPAPVAEALDAPLVATAAFAGKAIQPVIEQPSIASTLDLVDQLLSGTAMLRPDHALLGIVTTNYSPARTLDVGAAGPEPAAVFFTTAAADTRAVQVPAAGSPDAPGAPPSTPAAPAPSASAQGAAAGSGAQAASLTDGRDWHLTAVASAASHNELPPTFPTFDGDITPD